MNLIVLMLLDLNCVVVPKIIAFYESYEDIKKNQSEGMTIKVRE